MDVIPDFGERPVLEQSFAGAEDERHFIHHRAAFRFREVSKDAVEAKVAAIEALRSTPGSAAEPLRKALGDRSNYVCSKAAAMAGFLLLGELIPDLLFAFERFLKDPAKSDPQCWGKIAIVKALKELVHDDPDVFLRGMGQTQTFVDAESTLRGACALALVECSLPRAEILIHLADVLADAEMRVRIDAARAIAQLPGEDSMLMLRVKAQAGDKEPAVIGQCFLSLLGMDARASIPFVARYLAGTNEDLRFEATAALGECPDLAAVETLIARYRVERDAQMKRAIVLSLGVSRIPEAREFLDHLRTDTA
jgi:HEAT repeat protein